jgi:predicted metal-dependent HD superfamily phosphohydrolase
MTLITTAIRDELTLLYSSPTRHYHSLSHVNALLGLLSIHRNRFTDPDAVEAAIWFHDAIYDVRAQGHANEQQSAGLAVIRLGPTIDPARLNRIREMIEATATHVVPNCLNGAEADDTAMFLDMDLSILGADEAEFDQYEVAVREEYAFVDDDGWQKGRSIVLKSFVERERIYHSDLFRGLYEEAARRNLRRSLLKLESRQT